MGANQEKWAQKEKRKEKRAQATIPIKIYMTFINSVFFLSFVKRSNCLLKM